MNKKQFFKGLIIFLSTLLVGFGITVISFNLFDKLSISQMRLLFTFDFLALIAIGSISFWFNENKKERLKREQELNDRHEKRVKAHNEEMNEIFKIINNSNFAA